MAVNLTVGDVMRAIRIAETEDVESEVTRLLAVASIMVEAWAPAAPSAVQGQAAVQMVGYMYDRPTVATSMGMWGGFRLSGAAGILQMWRSTRAGAISGEDAPAGEVPTPGAGGNVPTPPDIGHWVLTSNNGVLAWVLFPEPE